ncbi:MAG: ribonuclease P protein component [Bradyrhizobiaceae bacterium]|nr:ribonuclease P protein component [Bradyrhizobiaceae bacterium]
MNVQPLKGFGAFDAILQKGKRFTVGPIGLTVLVTPSAPCTHLEFGVAIGKKTARHAVVRSRVRRLLRVALRTTLRTYGDRLSELGITAIIVIWRKPVARPSSIRLADVQPHVQRAFDQMLATLSQRGGAQ